ncbi:MAG: hypothetical protein E6J82_17905 [Deltaproteobacteria bacterium]|nr:MAG: hypothetical protein E6J82_17905 [Deltaproteobacteria bacterium]
MRCRLVAAAAISVVTVGLVPVASRADDIATSVDAPANGADGECVSIRAPIVTTFFIEGCTSPFGLCTEGTIPSGPLAGTTQFSVLSLGPGDSPELLLYGGELVITTPDGTLTIQDSGVLNTLDGTFFEIEQTVEGTGSFADHDGTLFAQGTSTPTGFEGTLSGQICRVSKDVYDLP